MLKQDDLIKSQLVLTAWRFSKFYNTGFIGAKLIMCTIANRVRAGWGSWLDVIQRVPDFMAEANLPALDYPPIWDGNFVKILHAVDGVYEGSAGDDSKGALYWGDLRYIERDWFKDKILSQKDAHPRVADFNSLSFFR